MRICHLYYGATLSSHIENIFLSFEDKVSLDINTIENIEDYDAYLIELSDTNKTIAAKLRALLKEKESPLIYFLIPEKYNLMFFQLTYLLESKAVFTQKQDTAMIIKKIKEDITNKRHSDIELLLGEISIEKGSFLIYKNNTLEYVSDQMLELFQCPDEDLFRKKIAPTIDLSELSIQDCICEQEIIDYLESVQNYQITSANVSNNTVVYFQVADKTCPDKDMNFISSRVSFIERLKERVLQRDIEENDLSVMTINMLNMKKLQADLDIVDLEDMFFELLTFIDSVLDRKMMLAQYERDSYIVLYENIYFQEVIAIANDFHARIVNHVAEQTYKPLFDVHCIDLNMIEFSEILSIFDNIKNNEMTPDQKASEYIVHSEQTHSVLNEKDMLDAAYAKQTPIKILNIYNGLVINTPAEILKVSKDAIQISFDQLQGVVINLEQSTVLQSSTFSQDIEASVRQIDLAKKMAILENFNFLRTNANSREYARVTTATKIPVTISHNKQTTNGTILDVSIKSIAVQIRYHDKVNELKSNDVSIVFNIPTQRSEQGFEQLRLGANIIAVTPEDINHNCKVVCDLDEDSNNEALLLEYVYERQKELIVELKKKSTLTN